MTPMTAVRSARQQRVPPWLAGTGMIAVAMGVMNVTTYGFTILAARLLGPAQYGALAAVMGLLLVVNVVSLGLQATGARRVSAAPADTATIEAEVMAASYRSALALGVLCLAATPLVSALLNLHSWATAALVAATAVPLTVMGGQSGILQGERRWGPLAWIYLCVGLGRIGFGAVTLLLWSNALGAMVGVTVGAVLPAVVGWLALRHPSRTAGRAPGPAAGPVVSWTRGRWARGGVLRETAHNSHALLAFFALSNADVLIARHVLPEHQAGLYAGGLILTKAVLFLPQFVVVIAFPSMSKSPTDRRMHLASLGAVAAIGTVTIGGVAVLSRIAVEFVGGQQYLPIQSLLWVFASLGTLLAMVQLLVYNVVARQHQRAVYVIWAALLALLGAASLVGSVTVLVTAVVCVDAALFAVLLWISLRPAVASLRPAES